MGALSFLKRPLISGQKCCIIAQVFNDILLATDSVDSVISMLLGAFETVDHNILISHIKHCVEIAGTALEWFRSYLSQKSFMVSFGRINSASALHLCGVPQGSILELYSFLFIFTSSRINSEKIRHLIPLLC